MIKPRSSPSNVYTTAPHRAHERDPTWSPILCPIPLPDVGSRDVSPSPSVSTLSSSDIPCIPSAGSLSVSSSTLLSPLPLNEEPYEGPPVQLHAVLVFTPSGGALRYDLTQPLETVKVNNKSYVNSLLDPVSSPPLRSLTLVIRNFPWRISVPARVPGGFVTIDLFLRTLYYRLRVRVSKEEYNNVIGHDAGRKKAVVQAYEDRVNALKDAMAIKEERAKGIRRVDFLSLARGHWWAGLERTEQANLWTLKVR